jgi:hypothetical protein
MPEMHLPTTVPNPVTIWYRGDFHSHTHFSDGVLSPDELVVQALGEGLDYLAITDHNTVGALSAFTVPPSLPIVRGIEITLKIGHFNVFGVDFWPDWLDEMLPDENRHRSEVDWQQANEMMARCKAEGWLVSINHPLLPPWEWKHHDTCLKYLDALEIWNDPTWEDNSWANPAAVHYWTRLLNVGYRITAIGGSDYHFTNQEPGPYQPHLGMPCTYVCAKQLLATAILDALLHHRAYMSMGPTLHFEAQMHGATFDIGTDLGAVEEEVTFVAEASLKQVEGRIQIVRNGEPIAEEYSPDDRANVQCLSQLNPDEMAWFRCDVLGADGEFLAVSNPIYSGPHLIPSSGTFGEFLLGV